MLRRFALNRFRLGATALALAAAVLGLLMRAPAAFAAADVHRFNLMLSATPTSIAGGDFNKFVDDFNSNVLALNDREGLDKITMGWLFQAKLSYFVRPNIALNAGVGQIHSTTSREYLPALNQSAMVSGDVISVPVDFGALYYMQPYNQGDFQARAFMGGGLTSLTYTKATFKVSSVIADPTDPLAQDQLVAVSHDSMGWYGEVGVHMFFAARYSVLISGTYRNAVARGMTDVATHAPVMNADGTPFTLDMSGAGVRGAVGIGF
jgi:hypothetical protein